jgi:ACS family glucarate transporter-like MFS transporter
MRRRHAVLLVLVVLSVITYLDRVCIGIAGTTMQAELGLTPQQWGWVLGVFAISYGVFEIPAGALGDRHGQRRVLTRIVVWWSAFTALTGMVSGYAVLLATRFLFGAGEAGAYPNMAGVVGRWFPPAGRGQAQGLIWGASRLGGALAPWLVVRIMRVLGWRAAFWIFGAVGVAWALFWSAWYRDPPTEGAAEQSDRGVPWGRLFRAPQLWLLMAMYWFYVWGSYFYLSWLPTYLIKGRGLTEAEMATCAALPFVLGAVGNVAGGALSDRLAARYGPRLGRRLVGSISLAISAGLILATAITPGKRAAVVLLSLGLGAMDCMLPSAWAICLDLGKGYAGAVSGAMNSAGQFGGFACSVAFGYVARARGYDAPLWIIAAMVLVSAGLFLGLDPTRPLLGPVDGPGENPEGAACV